MKTFQIVFLIAACGLGVSACSIQHVIEEDYPQYLANNAGSSNLPSTEQASDYYLTSNTQNHRYEFRAISTGYANLWIVEFGKMLDDSLKSTDVQNAFGHITKRPDASNSSNGLLIFDLQSYRFEGYRAQISINISLSRNGRRVFSKTYTQDGKSQGGKMVWAGAFGQKNAVQQSTKLAIDAILRQLITDLNTKVR